MNEQEYIITILVANKPSVTSRVVGLFSGRGYNMESICGAPTHDPEISRITIKTRATPEVYTEIMKQLNRLIDVLKVRDMTQEEQAVRREMALISVDAKHDSLDSLHDVISSSGARVVNEGADSLVVEITGKEEEVNSLTEKLRPFGIHKLSRSGILALYKHLEVQQ